MGHAGTARPAAWYRLAWRCQPRIVLPEPVRRTSLQEPAAESIGDVQAKHCETRRLVATLLVEFFDRDYAHEHAGVRKLPVKAPGLPRWGQSVMALR